MRIIKFLYARLIMFLLKIFPVKKNRIYFVSNFGQRFSCNPKAYFEYLYKNHRTEFEFYYCLNNNAKELLPKDVKTAKYHSLKDLYYLATSKYIVNNSRFHIGFQKRKNQVYIQTWHGSTLQFKAIERAIERDVSVQTPLEKRCSQNAQNDGKYIDIVTLGSHYLYDYYKKYFWNDHGIFTLFGNPRFDKIINSTAEDKINIRKKLNLPLDKKILLIAPTFKDNQPLSEDLLDNERLIKVFKENLGEDIIVAYRFHPFVADKVAKLQFNNCIDLTFVDDAEDVVLLSDYIITDFSSIICDGLFADKKCICYTKDLEGYIKNERHLWIDINTFPMPVLKSENELYEFLAKSKDYDWNKLKNDVIAKYGICETGHACEYLYKEMIKLGNPQKLVQK